MKSQQQKIRLGLERLLKDQRHLLRAHRVGLVCNQASVNHSFHHAADLMAEDREIDLRALFGPQHGIRGDVQDNMIETSHTRDHATGLPIYSLYSDTRYPKREMLKDVDVLVFDMQDVGCRIYTFAYTLANCMRVANELGKKVIVCDRPNPITGRHISGNILEGDQTSFVGQFPIPTRHGMTIAELASLFNKHFLIGCDLELVTMEGWQRNYWYDDTDGPWVMPSPNIPSPDTTTVFPGTVHLEGTQLSEGRGTTRPFELIGAPYIVPQDFSKRLNSLGLNGVYFRPCIFRPTFQKHAGVSCGGVQIHVTDREQFEPVIAGLAVVKAALELYPKEFSWKEPPYEYEFHRNPFDVIAGSARLRPAIEKGSPLEMIEAEWRPALDGFLKIRESFLLY